MKGTEFSKPTDPQTYSNTPESTRDNVEGEAVSANMPDTISTSSSEMLTEKTSKETDESAAQSENIGKLLLSMRSMHDDIIRTYLSLSHLSCHTTYCTQTGFCLTLTPV